MQAIESKPNCQYGLTVLSQSVESIAWPVEDFKALPQSAKWSARSFAVPPSIGTRVKVNFNGLGCGTIEGYFVEHGWVGVQVLPDARPDWHLKQNPGKNFYLVFGAEIEPV